MNSANQIRVCQIQNYFPVFQRTAVHQWTHYGWSMGVSTESETTSLVTKLENIVFLFALYSVSSFLKTMQTKLLMTFHIWLSLPMTLWKHLLHEAQGGITMGLQCRPPIWNTTSIAQQEVECNCAFSYPESACHSFGPATLNGFFICWYLGDKATQDRFYLISLTICTAWLWWKCKKKL